MFKPVSKMHDTYCVVSHDENFHGVTLPVGSIVMLHNKDVYCVTNFPTYYYGQNPWLVVRVWSDLWCEWSDAERMQTSYTRAIWRAWKLSGCIDTTISAVPRNTVNRKRKRRTGVPDLNPYVVTDYSCSKHYPYTDRRYYR